MQGGGIAAADRAARFKDDCPNGGSLLGTCEIECDGTLAALTNTTTIKDAIDSANIKCTLCKQKPAAHQAYIGLVNDQW